MSEVHTDACSSNGSPHGISVTQVRLEVHEAAPSPIAEALEESIAHGQASLDEPRAKPRTLRTRVLVSTTVAVGIVGIGIGIVHALGVFDQQRGLLQSIDGDTRSCLEVFSGADTDKDGVLVYDELRAFHRNVAKANRSQAERGSNDTQGLPMLPFPISVNDPVAEYLLAADSDHSGSIDFGEYMSMGTVQSLNSSDGVVAEPPREARRLSEQSQLGGAADSSVAELEDRLMRQWDGGFDGDGNRRLSALELEALLEAQGAQDARAEAERTITQFDEDFDGELSTWELEKILRLDAPSTPAVTEVGKEPGRSLSQEQRACNGAASLCSKRFDEVVFATTHNSYNNNVAGYRYANQYETMQTQLDDGIRGFMIDLHVYPGGDTVYLCHGGFQYGVFCPLGYQNAVDVLRPVRTWLEAHPNEVISFILELGPAGKSRPSNDQVEALFLESGAGFRANGIRDMLYDPTHSFPSTAAMIDAAWPILGDMIDADKRVVVLNPVPASSSEPWNLNKWRHVRYSPWSHKSRKASGISVHNDRVSCDQACSSSTVHHADARLHVLNHFITNPTSAEYAKMMNFEDVLAARTQHWKTTHEGHLPNFIAVDYYEIGHLFQVVDSLNGVPRRAWSCRRVGRTDLTKRYCCPSGNWWTTCSVMGSCNKRNGQCSCTRGWEFGFDCSGKVCKYGSKCAKWRWHCWNWAPGCCSWKKYKWWC